MKKQEISKVFHDMGYDYKEMEINKFYPVDEWEILSRDANGHNCWKKMTHIVRKDACMPVCVSFAGKTMNVSPEHVFFVKVGESSSWIEALDLVEEEGISLLHEDGTWVAATFLAGNAEVDILDLAVEDTECYFSNGVLSHNTLYGDPTTVPGGAAIPFHSSVRIKLGAGQQIVDKNKNVIGIHVSAKTIKNKVSAPFRKCDFEIHFGVGIKEHEQLFDVLRAYGPATINGKIVEVAGAAAWKEISVTDEETGEVLIEKKFVKSRFDEILDDPQYKVYLEDLIEVVMIKKLASKESLDIDVDSYVEVQAVSEDLDDVIEELSV